MVMNKFAAIEQAHKKNSALDNAAAKIAAMKKEQ